MTTTDSRVRGGLLKFTATGGGATATDFAAQITSCQISPSVDQGNSVEVLSGDKVGGSGTVNDNLEFTLIADWGASSATSLQAFSWANRGAIVDFEWQPDSNAATKWSGTVEVAALQIGGEVGAQVTVTATWAIRSITPPSGFGDGNLVTAGGGTTPKTAASK